MSHAEAWAQLETEAKPLSRLVLYFRQRAEAYFSFKNRMYNILSIEGAAMKRLGKIASVIVKTVVIAVIIFVIVIQLLPFGRNHSNPPVTAEPQWDSPRTRELFFRACADCHSNQTAWPWYTNIAPVSWLAERDVQEGRAKFNISEWGAGENKGDESAKSVQDGSMPLWFYAMIHPSARLSASEKQEFINGLTATFGGKGNDKGDDDD